MIEVQTDTMELPKNRPILEVKDLKVYFPLEKTIIDKIFSGGKITWVRAVDGVSFKIFENETLGLVGESGCGKTTIGKAIVRLNEPISGEIILNDRNILDYRKEQLLDIRKDIQYIFQDPYSSLNPKMIVNDIVGRSMEIHGISKGKEKDRKVQELLKAVGLLPHYALRYPHEFSGGQKQRIGVARALAVEPMVIIGDEPVSALDVSIQAQILNMLAELKERFNLTMLFISHDLGVVKYISDRIAVMYLGKIVEMAESNEIFEKPKHPYTKALLSAIPMYDTEENVILKGVVPSAINPPTGCRLHPRCPYVMDVCKSEEPDFKDLEGGHHVGCHLYN